MALPEPLGTPALERLTLTVVLPLSTAAFESEGVSAALPQAPVKAVRSRRILMVDDNTDTAWSIGQLLEFSGHQLKIASNGTEALRVADEWRPEVAVLDIDMPDISGHEIARRIRTQPWGGAMLLIAATGWAQSDDARAALEAGFDAHLAKPLDMTALDALIQGHPEAA